MKPKSLPSGTEIWTRNRIHLCPLNVVSTQMCVEDVAHALARQPMFGGHSAFYWSKAQHSITICERLKDCEQYLEKAYPNPNAKVFDLPLRKIRLMSLFHFAHHAYLEPIMGMFPSFDTHRARVVSACLDMVGEEYQDYSACMKLYDLVSNEISLGVYDRFYEVEPKDIYLLDWKEARSEFLSLVKSLTNKD